MTDETTEFRRDDAGNIIDPPHVPMLDRMVYDAGQSGDARLQQALQDQYHEHRADLVERIERGDREDPPEEDPEGARALDSQTDAPDAPQPQGTPTADTAQAPPGSSQGGQPAPAPGA